MSREIPTMRDSIRDALIGTTRQLNEANIPGANRDARLLLAHAVQIDVDRLTLVLPDAIDDAALARLDQAITRRIAREPVSHILGKRMFYSRDFIVTSDVLDPRPETEELIVEALSRPFASLLDLGTGSGAIILTLLAENPLAKGLATDISSKALGVAQQNANAFNLSQRARFQTSDWFADVDGTFDLIVSNPPYIAADEMADLAPELAHEPQGALSDGADGLTAYRAISQQAMDYLAPRGRIILEIGPTQGSAVAGLLLQHGFKAVRVLADMDGRDRVVCGQKNNVNL